MNKARIGRATTRRAGVSLALMAMGLLAGPGSAAAHGGDNTKIHGCFGASNGKIDIVGANEACKKNDTALDWPAVDTNTTYSAGSGLALSPSNVFSVTGAPWGGLTGVPAGFADGVDNVGSSHVQWNDIDGIPAGFADNVDDVDSDVAWQDIADIPADLLDGDDDGSTAVAAHRSELAANDGAPNETGDPVSFTKVKDLGSVAGGRILGSFVQDGTLHSQDVADGTLQGQDIADGTLQGQDIADGAISGSKLSGVVQMTTDFVDPPSIAANTRAAVTMTGGLLTGVKPNDLVTVSPPALLEPGLIFTGSDVLLPGVVTLYLYNISAAPIDGSAQTWTVRRLITDD
jgi:hypothetical protein